MLLEKGADLPNGVKIFLLIVPRLTFRCIDVGVRAKEGMESASLVPPRVQLARGMAKEATHIGAAEGETR